MCSYSYPNLSECLPCTHVKFTFGSSSAGFCHCGFVLCRPKPVKPVIPTDGRPPDTIEFEGNPGMVKSFCPIDSVALPSFVRESPSRASTILLLPNVCV